MWKIIHWLTKTKIYRIWYSMKRRCNVPKCDWYYRYWGRWITYDKKWEKFEEFYKDMWDKYKEWLSIDRIDNDWNYCKENCKWSTIREQQWNTSRSRMYKWKCIAEWCYDLELNYKTIHSRISRNWTIPQALWFENK